MPPEGILLLTFTNKAAREMTRRVEELAGGFVDVRRMLGGTFHHAAHTLLRAVRAEAGLLPALHGAGPRGRAGLDGLVHRRAEDRPGAALPPGGGGAGSGLHGRSTCSARWRRCWCRTGRSSSPLAEEVLAVALRFQQRKQQMNLMDFDDLLLHLKRLLAEHPRCATQLVERFRCVLVDEYQDTNRLQGDIVDLLAGERQNLTVVGDDCQSIYSFRGADFTNIIDFPPALPGLRRVPADAQLPLHAGDPPAGQRLHRAATSASSPRSSRPSAATGPCPCWCPPRTWTSRRRSSPSACSSCARRACRWRRWRCSTGRTATPWSCSWS